MVTSTIENYIDIIQCPVCKCKNIILHDQVIKCNSCETQFKKYERAFVLVSNDDQRLEYGKMLVNENNNEVWSDEAKWDKGFELHVPNGDGYLLDFACGGGRRKWCSEKGYTYIGLDYYNDYGVDIIANGMNIPIKDNSISIVTSSAVMEHIPDPWKACKEIFRIIKPGGRYVGSVAFLFPYHERSHYNMTHLGVKLMLEQAGFTVQTILPWKVSGLEAILYSLIGNSLPSKIVVSIFAFFEKLIMYLRSIVAKMYLFFYRNNDLKKSRIIEFLKEEKLRFTSGFDYVAIKK